MEDTIANLVDNIQSTVLDMENDDDNMERLEKAMQYFCGTHDKCEGYKYAILETLQEQSENHKEDLTSTELKELLDVLNGAI